MKTQETDASIDEFIDAIEDVRKRADCRTLTEVFARATQQEPRLWGPHIIGFGRHHYVYANGKPGVICKAGFAPRAKSFAFYLRDYPERAALLERLGRHSFSGGCLHLRNLDNIDINVLETIVRKAYANE